LNASNQHYNVLAQENGKNVRMIENAKIGMIVEHKDIKMCWVGVKIPGHTKVKKENCGKV